MGKYRSWDISLKLFNLLNQFAVKVDTFNYFTVQFVFKLFFLFIKLPHQRRNSACKKA